MEASESHHSSVDCTIDVPIKIEPSDDEDVKEFTHVKGEQHVQADKCNTSEVPLHNTRKNNEDDGLFCSANPEPIENTLELTDKIAYSTSTVNDNVDHWDTIGTSDIKEEEDVADIDNKEETEEDADPDYIFSYLAKSVNHDMQNNPSQNFYGNIHKDSVDYRVPDIYQQQQSTGDDTSAMHLKNDEANKPAKAYVCQFCNKQFSHSGSLSRHKNIHTQRKLYKCDVCSKTFNQRDCLKFHEKNHTGEKDFKCRFCDKGFTRPCGLKAHENIHTRNKVFTCSYCEKTFIQRAKLRDHERIHTGEKNFKCSFCDKCFTLDTTKKLHENIHTREKLYCCSFCDKAFTHQGSLKEHEMIHKGEKPFSCQYCDKTFYNKTKCKQHENFHTREILYPCKLCGRGFTSVNAKRRHEKHVSCNRGPNKSKAEEESLEHEQLLGDI